MIRVLGIVFLLIAMASCSSGIYSHYPKAKKQKVAKENSFGIGEKKKIHQVSISQKTINTNFNCNDAINPTYIVTSNRKINHISVTHCSTLLNGIDKSDSLQEKELVTNKKAAISFGLGLGSIAFFISSLMVPFLGGIAAFLGIAAFIIGILALKQIKKKPNTYNNRYMAIVGISVGALFIVATIFIVAFTFLGVLLFAK